MIVDNKEIIITGKQLKVAKLKEEWFEDLENPGSFIKLLKKNNGVKADIFTFWQRVPDTQPKFNYYMEWDNVAALNISTYDHWWNKQIDSKTRNVIRKAEKKGVVIKIADFNDDFVMGIKGIFDETPIRQDKPFWHYKKSIEKIKEEMSDRLDKSDWIGAYYNDELIGFIKLLYTDRYAMTVEILSMIKHRDKSPTNALMAKAVEICGRKKIPCIIYAHWPRGTLADFKRNNAFDKIDLPRYYVPLSVKGNLAIKLNLIHGIAGGIPEKLMLRLIDLRKKWYSLKI